MDERLSMQGLEFAQEEHVYTLDGVRIPSVTQLMEPLSRHEYAGVDEWTLRRAADRGTSVHNAIENYIKFGLDDIEPGFRGYMDGFLEWWEQNSPEVLGSEVRVYHRLHRYAGTVDLLAKIGGKLTLIDYKTTSRIIDKNVRVQLEAYSQALGSHGIAVDRKIALHLTMNGWSEWEYDARDAEALRVVTSLKCLYDYLLK